ncbi:hypothetical protein L0P88_08780 [Muricauda sp. SCSIO 64092]|uniref:hypothetical protein n=1 Tax=Allomuricauda sp. SCSIO 64092 TaxID=2908842 RepID=UPI001FF6B1E7|nr:hypothetical protein [Muricauda sp. SCSIO 64092]UOY08633.1 hypothetical protein L0P88_08780 [Muricauda sp. SCSIO 64092]
MKNCNCKYLVLMLLGILASCHQKQFDSEKEFWAYVKNPENGYYHEKTMGHVTYALTYRPTDILVKQALGDQYTKRTIDSLRKKYGDYFYFNLSMSAHGQELLNTQVGDRNAFGAMVNQLAFGMGQKLNLITQAQDTIPLLDYIYPRMYGMGRSTDMLLVYKFDQEYMSQEYLRLTIEDLGFGTGEVALKIDTEKIKNEPKLKF